MRSRFFNSLAPSAGKRTRTERESSWLLLCGAGEPAVGETLRERDLRRRKPLDMVLGHRRRRWGRADGRCRTPWGWRRGPGRGVWKRFKSGYTVSGLEGL